MRREEYVAIVVVLCAALIGASVMLRDVSLVGGITGAATANLPPQWQAESTKFALATNTPLALNLDALFKDPEGSELTFISTQTENLRIEQQDNTLLITPEPGFAGERVVTVIASDGEHIATKRLKIEVGDGFAPTAAPVATEPAPAPQEQAFESAAVPPSPQQDNVEDAVEEALEDGELVDVIIVLRKDAPEEFAAKATKPAREQALENIKNEVEENREELLGRVNDVPAITGAATLSADFEITHEYETINAIAVKLTRSGLAKLRNDPLVEHIVLDQELTADLADSIPLINANDVWNLTVNATNLTGKGEVICILDTGIDFSHSAFTDKTFSGYDFRNEDDSPQDDAFNSHGTHVAGIALGNSSAVKGVAPDARVLPAKVCDNTGSCTGSDLLAGIDFCNNKSATVNISAMSVSIGDGGQYNSTTCPTSFDAALNTSVSLGIIPVFASGNSGFTNGINFPACSPYAISVGSTTKADAISSFTNRGGDRLDILAPGSSIVSSVIGGGTGTLSGTSMATPHISGLIALVQQNQRAQGKPILSIAEMRALLRATGKEISLWNRIDAYAALVLLNQNYTINITDNSVTNMSPPKAKVKFKNDTDFSKFIDCSRVKHNFIDIDSAACPQFNKSAHITFEGLAGDTATPLRNGEACPAEICQNVTFSGGTLEFDVTSFTNFSSESNFSTQDVVTNCDPGPVVINTSTTLTNSISSNGTCLITNASNIVIDCDGFSIGFNANGSSTVAEFGINASITSGVTIRNCVINDLNSTSGGSDVNVMFDRANYTAAVNVTIDGNGSPALYFNGGHNNTIANSTIRSGSVTDGPAVRNTNLTGNLLDNSSISFLGTNNLIAFNTFTSNASTIIQQSGNARILYNNATIRTSLSNSRGIDTDPAGPFEITGNKIFVHTTGANPQAFRFASSNSNTSNNTFLANGTGARGVSIQASSTGTFTGNNFTVMGASSAAIEFLFAVSNSTRFIDTVISSEAAFIDLNSDTANSLINFTNTTFVMPNGSINIVGLAQLNGTKNVTLAHLNITNNRAYLNATNLSFLNQTGIVTLENIDFNDPKPQVAFNDATFVDCTSTADPFCTELGYGSGTFRFNTSHFTTFQTAEGDGVNLTGCATINSSAVLVQNVTGNGTCITIGASNIALNCQGFTILYDSAGTGGDGITANARNNITIRDCVLRDINLSGASGIGISLSNTENSTVTNNTVFTNGTSDNFGISLSGSSFNNITLNNITTNGSGSANNGISLTSSNDRNRVANNTISTNGAGGGNLGIDLGAASNFNNVTNNNIRTNSTGATGSNHGVRTGADDNDVSQNIILTAGPQGSNSGIRIELGGNTFTGNTITTTDNITTNCGNHGILATSGSSIISHNTVVATCLGGVTFGIFLVSSSSNNVTNNFVTVTGTSSVRGISVTSASTNNISHNTVNVLASNITNMGIDIGGSTNTISNNTIFVTGNETSIGINIEAQSNNNISYNRVIANGTRHNIGIRVHNAVNTHRFFRNNVTVNGTASYGISISISNNSIFNATLLDNPDQWINSTPDSRANLTDTTFNMPNGSITVPGNFTFGIAETNLTKSKLNITSNRAFLNSSNLSFMNTTGVITLNGLASSDPKPQFDFEDDGTFTDCTSTADPFCTEISHAGGVFVFNTSHFTSFQAAESGSINLTECATINSSATLMNNILTNNSCIRINASNVVLNCNNFNITANGSHILGINATSVLNVTINNCHVFNFSMGILFNNTNNSRITNTLISSSNITYIAEVGESTISLTYSHNNSISNITLEGIFGLSVSRGNNNTVNNVTFFSNESSIGLGPETRDNVFANITATNTRPTFTASGASAINGDGDIVRDSVFTAIADAGMVFNVGSNNTILNVRASSNTGNGFRTNIGNTFINVTAFSNTTFAMYLNGAQNAIIINSTGHSNSSYGIYFGSGGNNSRVIGGSYSSNTGRSAGFGGATGGAHNRFFNVTLLTNNTWLRQDSVESLGNNFTNTTFLMPNGSITIIGNFTLPQNATDITRAHLNITANRAFLNSSNLTFLNTTAIVTLNGLALSDPKPQFDFEDDGTFTDCTPTSDPFCTEISYAGGVFVFNTSHFTSFQGAESGALNLSGCATINTSSVLTQNITGNGTCIVINANNVFLTCSGLTIRFDAQGTGGNGVSAGNLNNVTIADCVIQDINASGNGNAPVNFTNVTNGLIINNTLIANGSSSVRAVRLDNSENNTIANNSIDVNGTGGTSGITLTSSSNNTVINNTLIVKQGSNTIGITVQTVPVLSNRIINNVITANGASGSQGIEISQASHTLIENNTITTSASIDFSVGISLVTVTSNTTVKGNNISANGVTGGVPNNHGIRLSASENNTFVSNSIAVSGTASSGIAIIDSNSSTFSNTILSNPPYWINSTGANSGNNFTNTSFIMPNGSIRFAGTFAINGSQDVTKAKLNITNNRAFLNSSNLTSLNTTGIITLNGLVLSNPKPQFDFEDDGTFTDCISTANPFCTEISYTGGTFVFNTSHFTTFQAAEESATVTSCPVTINTSTTVTQNLSSSGTCVTFGAHNIALDCANFNITYGTGNANDAMGVNITGFANATVVNCNIRKGGAGGNRTYGIGAFGAANARFENNTVVTNGTGTNDAIHVAETSAEFIPPGTVTLVNNDGNVNSPFCTNTSGTNSCQVCFSSPFSIHAVDCAFLGQGGCSDGEGFESESILSFNNTANITQGNIQVIGGEAVTCAMNGVTVLSFGTRNNCGTFNAQTINGSAFIIGQNNLTCSVAGGGSDEDNGFKLVKFTYTTGSAVVVSNTTDAAVQNNVLTADGGNDARGIFVQALRSNISRNNITTAGNRNNHGIYALEADNRVTDNVVRTVAGNQSNGLLIAGNTSVIAGNNVSTANSSASHGILMDSTARDSTVANNTIHVTALASDAVRVRATAGLYVNNTVLGATQAALFLESALSNRFNNTFLPTAQSSLFVSETQGTVNFTEPINITNLTNLSQVLSVTLNRTFLNATDPAGQQFNRSALLQLFSLAPGGARPVFDAEDDGSFSNCNAPRCRNATFNQSAGILQFNASLWTTYAGQAFADCTTLDNDDNITQINFTLETNITSSLTCLEIVGENVTVNCAGHIIFYDSAGGGGDGITFPNPKNLRIENCTLIDINAGGSGGVGLNGSNASHVIIRNNSITTNGTSGNYGIHLVPGPGFGNYTVNNTIANNTIRTFGTTTDNIGIRVDGRAHNNTVRENTIVTNGTSANYGMFFFNRTRQNFILSNRVNTTGNDAEGIVFDRESLDNIIANNTIHVNNSGTFSASGVYILNEFKANNTIASNIIIVRSVGSVDPAIHFEAGNAENNTVANNTITVMSSGASEGVRFFNSGSDGKNNIIENNTINVATNSTTLGDTGIFIRQNNNTIIRWNTITIGNATPANNLKLANNDVGISILITANAIIANNTITVRGLTGALGIEVAADSNHNRIENNTVFVESNGSRGAGIELIVDFTGSGVENNTIRSNVISVLSNESNNYGILLTGNVTGNIITHNTISANGSNYTMGVRSESRPSDTVTTQDHVIEFNNITTRGTGSHNYGVFIYITAPRHNITNNNITTQGVDRNHGIFLNASASDGLVRDNNITLLTTGFDNYGILLAGSSQRNTVRNNNIRTTGTGNNTGIRLQGLSNSNVFANNSVVTAATGAVVNSSRLNAFLDNNISAGNAEALRLEDSFNNNFTGNVLATNGGITLHAPGGVLADSFSDGFEDGTLSPFTTTGNVSWTVNDSAANTGTFSAKAGTIGNSQRSSLILNITLVAPGTLSFARRVSSEQDFDFLRFAIDGSEQQTWSGELAFETFLFSVGAGTHLFTWNYTKDSSSASGNDTAWIDDVTIITEGAASQNNTFNRTTLLANNTWLFVGVNSTNNTLQNTTFEGGNGSITVIPATQAPEDTNASIGRLNVSFNRAYLNSSNLSFLNRTGIVRLRGITPADPSPTVDPEDDGTFADCTPTADPFCTELSFSGGVFTYNTSHFTAFSSTEPSTGVTLTLTKSDSPDPVNASSNLSYTILVNLTQGNASNITLTDTYPAQVIFLTSQPTAISGTNNTFVIGNLTANATFTVNITVLVLNITNGTVINNTANISFQNQSGNVLTLNVTESTTVLAPVAAPNVSSCPVTINTSTTLTQSLQSSGTCITIGANGVTLNCANFSILYDSAGVGGDGIVIASRTNVIVENCTIIDINASGPAGIGINVTGSTVRLRNNSIQTNGTRDNHGITLFAGTTTSLIANNTIRTQGTLSNNTGILVSFSTFLNITGNTILTNGSFNNFGIRTDDFSENNRITNNTIMPNGGSFGIGVYLDLSDNNRVERNTIITNGTFSNYGVLLNDFTDYATVANNTISTGGTASGNIGVFIAAVSGNNNVTDNIIRTNGTFSNYGVVIQEFAAFNRIENNSINTGGNSTANYGIFLVNLSTNTTVHNNLIRTSGSDSGQGIVIRHLSHENNITNNTILTNSLGGFNIGLYMETQSDRNRITGNIIVTNGTTSNNGINLLNDTTDNRIENNSITTDGTGSFNWGIWTNSSDGTVINRNFIRANGRSDGSASSVSGIVLQSSTIGSTVENNTITVFTNGSGNFGIDDAVFEANMTNNVISVTGSSESHGIRKIFSQRSIARNNTITVSGAESDAIQVRDASTNLFENNTLSGHTRYAAHVTNSLRTTFNRSILPAAAGSLYVNESNGSITWLFGLNITNATNLSQVINVSFNSIFLNSTDGAGGQLNHTAELEFRTLTFLDPQPLADIEDDATFALCTPPTCREEGYTGGIFTYNVTAFTTYSSGETGGSIIALTKTDSPDPANMSQNLTYVINVTSTGNTTAHNVTVNDTYPSQVIFLSSQPTAVTGTNNTFILGNLTPNQSVLVNITVLVLNITNGTVINNTANATFQNTTGALFSAVDSENTTVQNETVAAPAAPAGQGGGSGGGGNGGGGGVKYDLQQPQPEAPACMESWACEDWLPCVNGLRVRYCVDQNNCNTTFLKPGTGIICETPAAEQVQSPAAPVEPEPLELPELHVPQTEPEPETFATRLCAILPAAINGALLVLAVLVILYWVRARKGNGRAVRVTADVVSVIILAALIAEYVLCRQFLPVQYVAFVVLVLAIIAEHLVALVRARGSAAQAVAMTAPPAEPEDALQPAPVPAIPARIAAPVLKQAAEAPPRQVQQPAREKQAAPVPAPITNKPFWQPAPKKAIPPEKILKAQKLALHEEATPELKEIFSTLQSSGDALAQFNKRLAQIEKNLSKHSKKRNKR